MQFMMSYIDHYEVFISMSTIILLMASKFEHVQLYFHEHEYVQLYL